MTLFSIWEDMLSESFRPLGHCCASALKQRRHGEAAEHRAARAACTVVRKPSQERATAAPGISQKSALPPDTFSQVPLLVPQVIFSTQPHNTGVTKKQGLCWACILSSPASVLSSCMKVDTVSLCSTYGCALPPAAHPYLHGTWLGAGFPQCSQTNIS